MAIVDAVRRWRSSYAFTTLGDAVHWCARTSRAWRASAFITFLGMLVGAVDRDVGAVSPDQRRRRSSQALAFELERSEYERKALDARLRLLQAQVEPHFLFNTLANVRELVDSGSPQASAVLGSLIAYLRAAVPRLHEPATTLAQELRAGARVPRGDAHAHARPPAVRVHADDAARWRCAVRR